MRCANCGSDNPERMKFCEDCGTKLVRACPSCGREVRPTAKFCGECGTPLAAEETPAPAKRRTRKGANTSRQAPRPPARPTTVRPSAIPPEAERRQLTVMFCDLVGSTALSEQLDPEELREVIRAYQETCAGVIGRFEGHIAQYLGDGLLVYFGYPQAHEDDAQRAVRTGLEIVGAIPEMPLPNTQLQHPLQIRIGIHTGPVVVGEMGGGGKREQLALGETPNIAARLQGIAAPDTVVISAATQQLIAGLFTCQDLGRQELKGISMPVPAYCVLSESGVQSRFEVAIRKGLTPLVGREEEMGILRRRWEQVKAGEGQVVLLSGEAGIGKSRLVQTLKEQVMAEGATRIEFRCSAYHQNSAFYPIIEHLQRLLQFAPDEAPQTKLVKLQQVLAHYRFPQADTLPLLAALLSLPHPEDVSPITLSPQKQKQKTQEALVAWIVEEAEKAALYCAWEDLHWADPSTLEVLTLFLDQVPTTRLLALLTFRPDFTPPWRSRSHITQLTLTRLGRSQVEAMVTEVTGGKTLPAEVLQQIVSKTDGVPLFVEELTKMVLESNLLRETKHHYELTGPLTPFAIPSTLQDSLMARLDRLATVREIAQLGATVGREFSYEVLHAVSPLDEETLQHGLKQLVEAELVYQRGLVPQAHYLFKHALIQDTAYQALLKSTRQQYHRQIAQVLVERFPEAAETQPELVAHHYTEAGLIEQALPYWQRAGERATQRSAHMEAIAHFTKGLELLKTLPDTPERAQQELLLQTALGPALMATKGMAVPEVERAYTRARELCRQVGETPQLLPVLFGLCRFYNVRAEYQTGRELGEQLLRLAQRVEPIHLVGAHHILGAALYWLGEFAAARSHLEEGVALYNRQQHHSLAFVYGTDPGVTCLTYLAWTLWELGYPEQARERIDEMLTLAQALSHSFSLAYSLSSSLMLSQLRREGHATQERAEATIAFSSDRGFLHWVGFATPFRGWALAVRGQGEEGIAQMRQTLTAYQAIGLRVNMTYYLGLLAEAYEKTGQAEEGLTVLAEALALVQKTGERGWEAELYRLKGELTLRSQSSLRQVKTGQDKFEITSLQYPTPSTHAEAEAEACFLKAIEIARKQNAKPLELRAVMSLSRLWQSQGKRREAHEMLAEIYGWFTEGFDTKDLQEAKALLQELA